MIGVIHISATNRGSKRIESDFYKTPANTIHKFLESYNCDMNGLNVFEPCAGDGSICQVIRERYPECKLAANELRQEERDNLVPYCNVVLTQDFLTFPKINNAKIDIIISNPPYSIAKEIIEHCFEIANDDTIIIMLLRTAFLESKTRYSFWQRNPVNGLYVLSSRPSFTGNGKSDATSYSWFVWDRTDKQTIKVI